MRGSCFCEKYSASMRAMSIETQGLTRERERERERERKRERERGGRGESVCIYVYVYFMCVYSKYFIIDYLDTIRLWRGF